MSSGNQGDNPFYRAETIVRPQPGGARRAEQREAAAAMRQAAPVAEEPAGMAPSLAEFIAQSRNPLLSAGAALLILGARLRTSVYQANAVALRQQAVEEHANFLKRAQAAGVPLEDAQRAGYILCTFVDLAVFATPWGAQSGWDASSLLSSIYRDTQGGEKFCLILEHALNDPARFGDLIELQYVCLALGIELPQHMRARADELEQRAARFVRERRASADEALSPHWRGEPVRERPLYKLVPWWLVGLVGLTLLVGLFIYYQVSLNARSRPLQARLVSMDAVYEAPPSQQVSRLKTLLAERENAGELKVEDFGDRTLITIPGAQLFRSGSAQLNEQYVPVVQAIAAEANKIPGRLLVIGHTDDQPLRSLQYKDNFDLSRARAIAVARILSEGLSDPARVEWIGVADTQPRYKPPGTPENRALNRRVEIVHFDAEAVQ